MLIAWIARQQTKIASATSASQMLPQVLPRTSFVIDVRPNPVALLSTAIVPKPMSRKPRMPAVSSARISAFGAVRRGSAVSSASEPALSNPYMT